MPYIYTILGDYRPVTEQGWRIIRKSVETLGYKEDEKIYIRLIYSRDMVSPNYHSDAKFLVVDGNHRAD